MRSLAVCALVAGLVAGCATGTGRGGSDADAALLSEMFAAVPASTPPVVTGAALGTVENPVRAVGPPGQRDYLARLRCDDGLAPTFSRTGSLSRIGPYGKILDSYAVTCRGAEPVAIAMDMYHCAQDERTVPGFQLMAPIGEPLTQEGCDLP